MKKIPLTKGKFALIDDDDYEYINRHKWFYLGAGTDYAARSENDAGKKIIVFMHRVIIV